MIKDLCFEIIWKCPNKCMFCSSNACIEKEKYIDLNTFKKTIDFLFNKYGIREVSLSGGEPLLHQDLFKLIEYCKMKKIRVVLFTSGIKTNKPLNEQEIKLLEQNLRKEYFGYLNEGMPLREFNEFINKLLKKYINIKNIPFTSISTEEFMMMEKLGLDKIVFDFQCFDREKYNKIMGTTNTFDALITSLAKVSHYNIEKDAHFIPTKINYKELKDIIEILNYANFDSLSILNFVPQGRGYINKDELMMSTEEFKEFVNIYNIEKEKFNGNIRIGIPLLENNIHKCTAGFSKLVIKYDGTVLPCPAFKETDLKILNELGYITPNIYTNLNDIELRTEREEIPLCKKLYNFTHNIK